jgi:GH35 family endo-1,4-beta-xylanase
MYSDYPYRSSVRAAARRLLSWILAGILAHALQAQTQTIPSGGAALLTDDVATTAGFYANDLGQGPVATRTTVNVTGQTFTTAARVATIYPSGEYYRSAMGAKFTRSVADGDVVLVHFFMRAITSGIESGEVTAQVYVEGPAPNYASSMSEIVSAGPAWTEFFMPLTVNGNFPSGDLGLNFGFGAPLRAQTLEVGGIEAIWYGKSRTLAEMPRTSFQYDGRAADAPWRAEAAARIEQYRKGNFTVKVVDGSGNPVSGAHVRVRQQRHAFQFGTAFVGWRVLDDSDQNNAVYRAKLLELFNAGSFENDLKWQPWIGEWGSSFSPEIVMSALKWAQDNGISMRGHVLVWPSVANMPTSLSSKITASDPSIPDTILSHIDDVTLQTKDYLGEWDVLNEPYSNHDIMDRYGKERMVDWFKRARTNLPTADLFINDFAILSGGGLNVDKQAYYEDTIRYIRDGGGPLTGIGFQGHFSGAATGIPRIWEILQRYATAFPDAKLRITEFDHNTTDEQLQADFLRDFLTLAFSHPQMVGVQLWGFWEGAHWLKPAALYRQNWDEKPNGAAYRQLVLHDWWTDVSSRSDTAGTVTGRGFAGTYAAEVTVGGASHTQTFELSTAGATVTVTLAAPTITVSPMGGTVAIGAPINLSVTATGSGPLTYQWRHNGKDVTGATAATLTIAQAQPSDAGVYTVAVTGAGSTRISDGAVVGIAIATKVEGSGEEVGPNILHQNGNMYDQILITGPAVTFTADPGQVTRASYVDLNDDIVQVEFSGAGSVTVVLADPSDPAAPVAYNQPNVSYMKGHATIVVAGTDQTSNISVFTVGKKTAVNQALFKSDWDYDGVADLALLTIQSNKGTFGGVRCANAEFYDVSGSTGVSAPGVAFAGPFYVHNIAAQDNAVPMLVTGTIGTGGIGITGGDLHQPNGNYVEVGEAQAIEMRAGEDSHGRAQPTQANAAVFDRNGEDVTATIVLPVGTP